MLSQMIYTSTSAPGVSLADKVKIASYSVAICNQMGLTGRVLVVPEMAINVLEGPEVIITRYVEAIRKDALIDLVILHHSQLIDSREFDDYSVWMTYKPDVPMAHVYQLTADNFQDAVPKTLPLKTRLFIEASIDIKGIDASTKS